MKYANYRVLFTAGLLAFSSLAVENAPVNAHDEQSRLRNSGEVMHEILNVPDDIPQDLLDKARCVVVMPSVLKAAFVVGGSYGRGTMVCRTGKDFSGPWGAPAMFALEGGSFGLQIGGEATDFVFLIMNDRGANSLMHSKVKLGADASAAAGPKGRSAEADSDAYMRAEILSYSRARGVFAGVSSKVPRCVPTTKPIASSTAIPSAPPKSSRSLAETLLLRRMNSSRPCKLLLHNSSVSSASRGAAAEISVASYSRPTLERAPIHSRSPRSSRTAHSVLLTKPWPLHSHRSATRTFISSSIGGTQG